jgi:NADH-quinone oxidoreductase subunit L
MFRVVFIAFFGRAHDPHGHPHDAPLLMAAPLWVLAGLSVGLGVFLALGNEPEVPHAGAWLVVLSLALAAAGILLAWATYQRGAIAAELWSRLFAPIDALARQRYFLDEVFTGLYRGVMLVLARLIGWVDRYLVDGVLNVLSAWTLRAGDLLRRIQTGQPQDYVYGVAFGVLVLLVLGQLVWP